MPSSWSWSDVEVAVPPPSYRLPGVTMAGFRHRVAGARVDIAMVAHPSVTLLVDLGAGSGIVYDVRGGRQRGSVVVGLLPGDLRAWGTGPAECLQIRLEPDIAAAVFRESEPMVTLADLWGSGAARFEDALRAASSWNERFLIATRTIATRLGTHQPVDAEVARAWRRTIAGRGLIRVETLADEIGWSRKRLWSRFRSQLGITPKRAAGLIRFDHAAHLLAAGRSAAGVAIESGYADQSHLHRDVRAITGLTPAGVATAPWLAIDHLAWPSSP